MKSKYKDAVEHAQKNIKHFEKIGALAYSRNLSRLALLGIYNSDFSWQDELDKADKNFDSFDALKGYCSNLILTGKPIPQPLKEWLAAYLNGIFVPPKRKRGGLKTGADIDMYLPQLIHRVAKDYDLHPTRNAASPPISACDAVSEAISKFEGEKPVSKGSYDSLSKAYSNAKKKNALVG